MSEVRRILSTSIISFLLVIWGLFMVCSGRVPSVAYDDEFMGSESEYNGTENSDLMTQLAVLDEEATKLEDYQRNEILEALGIDPAGAPSNGNEQDFLTEELFLDLEVEIADLEKLSGMKTAMLDSLRQEVEETDHRLTAVTKVVGGSSGTRFASSTRQSAPQFRPTNGSNSDYALSYQSALDDVYAKEFGRAIAKFEELLRLNDTDNLADNAQYWIGECHYAEGNYESAIAEFEKVFAFDDNNKIDDAQFMIGIAYIKSGDSGLAQIELNNLLSFYQDSEYTARAEREFLGLNI